MNVLMIIILLCSALAAILVLFFMIDYRKLNSRSNIAPALLLLVSVINIIAVALSLRKGRNN